MAIEPLRYNCRIMSLIEQIQKDITAAMKAREEQRLSTLRMVKTALKNREIDKMAPLDDKEAQQVLSTLIKQRKDSVEQFTKGGRQEMADKEAAEIKLIEAYMPKAAGEDEIVARRESRDRRDGLSYDERHGNGDEECHGAIQCRRTASGWQAGERSGEARADSEMMEDGSLARPVTYFSAIPCRLRFLRFPFLWQLSLARPFRPDSPLRPVA